LVTTSSLIFTSNENIGLQQLPDIFYIESSIPMDTPQNETPVSNSEQPTPTFESFGLRDEILKSIQHAGFREPSPIQQQVIPLITQGLDVIGQAHTGTGKTAAFGLPTINALQLNSGVEILVITPTRELANQVSDELYMFGRNMGVRTVTIYGGRSYSRQIDLIDRGANIVVATPGRLLDLLSKKALKKFAPTTIILDEADEMLDMGFLDEINEIFTYLPEDRQTLLFSATMPPPIKKLASQILFEPKLVSITKEETTNKDITQKYYIIEEKERDDAIIRLLDSFKIEKSVVFCRTKKEVDRLSNVLSQAGYISKGLHGDMEQQQRDNVIKGLKSDAVDILVATDVAARGLHINNVSHVFNYHIPFDPESYVHRIGRTGRAGQKGYAITLVTPLEFKELQRIKKIVGTSMEHCFIPSSDDVKHAKANTLIEQILNQPIDDEAVALLSELQKEIDSDQISFKLISLLIQNVAVIGPKNIGLSPEHAKKVLSRPANSSKNGRFNRRGGGGRRHDSRRGDRNNKRAPRNSSQKSY